jgi:hypothetical protein
MADVIQAVVFVILVFFLGIAFGFLLTVGLSARGKRSGPGPRGGGQGPEPG